MVWPRYSGRPRKHSRATPSRWSRTESTSARSSRTASTIWSTSSVWIRCCTARTGRTPKGWRSRRSTSMRCRTCPSRIRQRSWAATSVGSSPCDALRAATIRGGTPDEEQHEMTKLWQTIPEMVLSAADRFGDADAIVDGPLRLTFTEVVDRVRCAAGAFAGLGIDKGDRVAIWAPNSAEWIIAAFGLLTAGGVLVPVNTRFKAEEAGDVITRSAAKAVLVQKGFLGQDYTAPAGVPVIELKSDFLSSASPFERTVNG